MKKYFLSTSLVIGAITLGVFFSAPQFVSAATSTKPRCSLEVKTPAGEITTKSKTEIFIAKNERLNLLWQSQNAKKATDTDGEDVSLSGFLSEIIDSDTTYKYEFVNGSKKTICSVDINVVAGEIDQDSLTSSSATPTIHGTVSGTKTVQIIIRKEGSGKIVYRSKNIKVKNGDWKNKVSKKLADGVYEITLAGPSNIKLNTIASGTLTIGKNVKTGSKANTTMTVSAIPLLFGGVAKSGSTVPVSYIQVKNIGPAPATLTGFKVKVTGGERAIIGLSTVDGNGGSRGLTGGTEGINAFKNGLATVPTTAVFAPGQMRVFTIKAILSKNVSTYAGQSLSIQLVGLESNASAKGMFPIAGAPWTIAN